MHRWVEHTGELELALEAPEEAELFADALVALNELLADSLNGPPERREIVLHSPERATLLGDWLGELVFLGETKDFVPSGSARWSSRPMGYMQLLKDAEADRAIS